MPTWIIQSRSGVFEAAQRLFSRCWRTLGRISCPPGLAEERRFLVDRVAHDALGQDTMEVDYSILEQQ